MVNESDQNRPTSSQTNYHNQKIPPQTVNNRFSKSKYGTPYPQNNNQRNVNGHNKR